MLQTIQAKTDTTKPTVATKEKEVPADDLAAGRSTFFAQFMAAMPNPGSLVQNLKPAEAPREATRNQAALDRATLDRAAQERDDARSNGRQDPTPSQVDPAQARGAAGAQERSRPESEVNTKDTVASADDPTQSAPAKADSTKATGDAAAKTGEEGKAAGTANATAVPGTAAAPETIAAAKAQADLEQMLPGVKVQFEFGTSSSQATRKPALAELLNQPKVDLQTPNFAGVGGGSGEPAATTETLPGLQSVIPAAQEALLALGQPLKEAVPAAIHSPGNFSAAEAVGASTVPGASGAVRVTPTTASEAPAPMKRDNPMGQVDASIKWLIKNKDQSAELQLHPEALGRVQIKLTVEGTQVHAKLWASEAAAVPILQEHRAFLESSLKAQGLTLGSFDLQQGHQSDQTPTPQEEHAPPPLAAPLAAAEAGQETPSLLPRGPFGSNRIEIVA